MRPRERVPLPHLPKDHRHHHDADVPRAGRQPGHDGRKNKFLAAEADEAEQHEGEAQRLGIAGGKKQRRREETLRPQRQERDPIAKFVPDEFCEQKRYGKGGDIRHQQKRQVRIDAE